MGAGLLSLGKSGTEVKLNIRFHIVSRVRMSGAVPLLPLCAFMARQGKLCLFTIIIITITNYAGRIKLQSPSVVGEMSIIVNRLGVKYRFLIIKANEMHYFSNLFGKELYMFRTDLLSIISRLNTVFTAIGICHTSYIDCLLERSGPR
jgi:hypothetical protein